MSLGYDACWRVVRGFPRVSGDEPAATNEPAPPVLFSPRERG